VKTDQEAKGDFNPLVSEFKLGGNDYSIFFQGIAINTDATASILNNSFHQDSRPPLPDHCGCASLTCIACMQQRREGMERRRGENK
jgi:hypothetical protein